MNDDGSLPERCPDCAAPTRPVHIRLQVGRFGPTACFCQICWLSWVVCEEDAPAMARFIREVRRG